MNLIISAHISLEPDRNGPKLLTAHLRGPRIDV